MLKQTIKKELTSAGYTFLTVAIPVLLAGIETINLDTIETSAVLGLLGAALRAGLKAAVSVLLLALKTYFPKDSTEQTG